MKPEEPEMSEPTQDIVSDLMQLRMELIDRLEEKNKLICVLKTQLFKTLQASSRSSGKSDAQSSTTSFKKSTGLVQDVAFKEKTQETGFAVDVTSPVFSDTKKSYNYDSKNSDHSRNCSKRPFANLAGPIALHSSSERACVDHMDDLTEMKFNKNESEVLNKPHDSNSTPIKSQQNAYAEEHLQKAPTCSARQPSTPNVNNHKEETALRECKCLNFNSPNPHKEHKKLLKDLFDSRTPSDSRSSRSGLYTKKTRYSTQRSETLRNHSKAYTAVNRMEIKSDSAVSDTSPIPLTTPDD